MGVDSAIKRGFVAGIADPAGVIIGASSRRAIAGIYPGSLEAPAAPPPDVWAWSAVTPSSVSYTGVSPVAATWTVQSGQSATWS